MREDTYHPSLIFDEHGQRKYLTDAERTQFLDAAKTAEPDARTFALTLAYTGCRISEALSLRAGQIDVTENRITFETLKRRKKRVFRSIPVPAAVIEALDLVHTLRRLQRSASGQKTKLWTWSRSTGYRRIMDIFATTDITGPQTSPHGLRHAFGVTGIQKAPLNTVQKGLGHKDIKTTALYCEAVGQEETELAARMWATD